MDKQLKAYFWEPFKDSEHGIAVIAENSKEARKIGWSYWGSEHGNDDDFIEQNCRLIKPIPKIDGLKKGAYDDFRDGLIRGLYGKIYGLECDFCKKEQDIISDVKDDKIICFECIEKDSVNNVNLSEAKN